MPIFSNFFFLLFLIIFIKEEYQGNATKTKPKVWGFEEKRKLNKNEIILMTEGRVTQTGNVFIYLFAL